MPGISTNILDQVRSSCRRALDAHPEVVRIVPEAVASLVDSLDPSLVSACTWSAEAAAPLKFPNREAEITFLGLFYLLQFGSGYEPLLQAKYRRGALESTQYGLIGSYMSCNQLDTAWMSAFSQQQVMSCFGIDSHEESPLPGAGLPGVTMSRPGPLAAHTQALVAAVKEVGGALQEEDSPSLGQWLTACVDALHKRKHPSPAAVLVAELVDSLPPCQDSGLVDGSVVVFARKAQALVGALHARFAGEDPRFCFADVGRLTADSGNVLPGVLRHLGVLEVSPQLATAVDSQQELPQGASERVLRAGAVCAADAIVSAAAAAGKYFTASQLGRYLCIQHAKDVSDGNIKLHLTRGTMAY